MKSRTTSFPRLLTLGVILTVGTLATADTVEPVTYSSPQGYTIVPPAAMHQVDASEPGMDVEFDDDAEDGMQFSIAITPVDPGVSLEQGLRATRAKLEEGLEDQHYKVLEQGALTLDGSKALMLAGSLSVANEDNAKAPPKPYRLLTILTYRGGNSYVFNYGGPAPLFAQTRKSLDKSLASLRWTK